ncbi:hypothetical protein [Natrinema salaciae]|uniref:Uncharacterized protein n=1 Tax=Natrinema salaciae TaxID=1186196 RepID=A0A1H9GU83_9EURY|nr:hypothetical protein [Natrinema salaciae]SEQ53558.1 hypothetical protein SAMN04489841_1995 [Natrinema salaciae]
MSPASGIHGLLETTRSRLESQPISHWGGLLIATGAVYAAARTASSNEPLSVAANGVIFFGTAFATVRVLLGAIDEAETV